MKPGDSAQIASLRSLLPARIAAGTRAWGATLILPRLYLSNYTVAVSPSELNTLGITHIISVLDFTPETCPAHIKRLCIKLNDTASADVLLHLEQTTEFIRSALQEDENNKVLVHCLMGISRSTTVVCAYMIAVNQMTAKEALESVVQKRSIACPNAGFRVQLEIFESQCHKTAAIVTEASVAEAQLMKVVADNMERQTVERTVRVGEIDHSSQAA